MNPFVFIVGCPRSGTTLLKRMVDAHPDIAITRETHWITELLRDEETVSRDMSATPELVSRLIRRAWRPSPRGPRNHACQRCSGSSRRSGQSCSTQIEAARVVPAEVGEVPAFDTAFDAQVDAGRAVPFVQNPEFEAMIVDQQRLDRIVQQAGPF